jgi:flavin-binding protein dodecin
MSMADGKVKRARHVQQTVDWAACMDARRAADIGQMVELGPCAA